MFGWIRSLFGRCAIEPDRQEEQDDQIMQQVLWRAMETGKPVWAVREESGTVTFGDDDMAIRSSFNFEYGGDDYSAESTKDGKILLVVNGDEYEGTVAEAQDMVNALQLAIAAAEKQKS